MHPSIKMLPLPGHLNVVMLKWALVAFALTILTGGLGWAVQLWVVKLNKLIALGWADYVGWSQGNLLIFTSACARDEACQAVLTRAWQQFNREFPLPFLGASFLISAVGAAVTASFGPSMSKKSPGGARWATKADLAPLLRGEKNSPQRGYLGLHPSGKLLRPPERLRCAHTLIIGGTGAGKSTGYYKPNLLLDAADGCSAVVIDLKFPDTQSGLFGMISAFTEKGHDVQLFLPYGDASLRLPLLAGAEDTITASQITDILTPLSDRGSDGGFFSKQQRALLTGLIMGFTRSGNYSLAALVRLLLAGSLEVEAYVRHHLDEEVRERLAGFFEQDKRIRNGVVRGLVEELEPFTDPRLERSTTPSENAYENLDLTTISTRPSLLYIGIPQDELMRTRGQALLQLIKRLLDRSLIGVANAHGGQLPVHTSVYLDEFASLGELPNVGESFATMRSRRVAYHLSLQNRAQGEALYGPTAFRSFISGNVRQTLIFPRSLSFEDATYFSEMMGELTAVAHTKGTTRKHIFDWPHHLERQQEVARPLLSPEEMRDFPEGMGILLQGGSPPTRVLLPRLDKKRFAGVRNPLFPFYDKHFSGDIQVAQTVQSTLLQRQKIHGNDARRRLRIIRDRHISAAPSLSDQSAETDKSEHQIKNAVSQKTAHPEMSAHQTLKDWFGAVLERGVPVQLETALHSKEVVCLLVSRAALPENLQQPEDLKTWLARGWVAQTGETIALFGEGLELIGKGTVKRLQTLHKRRKREQAKRDQRVRVHSDKDKTPTQLRTWIIANAQQLDGHPAYEILSNEQKETADVLGWYQPGSLKLLNKVMRKVLGDIPENFQPVRINNRQGAEIRMSDLEKFPQLADWCREHSHLFKGHSTFNAEGEPVGSFQEEAVALPKREYQRILGRLPETKRRDLTIGYGSQRRKRRLYMYIFAEEAF